MNLQTELIKLGMIQLAVSPNPWSNSTQHFNQTLDLATGTVYVGLGDVRIAVWIDALADVLKITVTSPSAVSIKVVVSSTRPSKPWTHNVRSKCSPVTTNPDIYLDTIPAQPFRLSFPGPIRHPMKHASASKRPLRLLQGLPKWATFSPGTIIAYHRNNASEGEALADMFKSQGIESLLSTTPDHWTDLQCGFALDAEPGFTPMHRIDSHTLSSFGTSFALRATVLAVQTSTEHEWLSDLAALQVAAPSPYVARVKHEEWYVSAIW